MYVFTCMVRIYTSTYLHMYICLVLAKLTSMLTFKAMLKDERMVDEEAALRYKCTYVRMCVYMYDYKFLLHRCHLKVYRCLQVVHI